MKNFSQKQENNVVHKPILNLYLIKRLNFEYTEMRF